MLRVTVDFAQCCIPDREEGQGLVEYGMVLLGVAIAVLVALFALGPRLNDFFTVVGSSLKSS
jgi:pilus assembly protein Flp/PilA